jgi:hypothetical protein
MGLVRAVARSFERGIAPLRLAEAWDNVRLHVGSNPHILKYPIP